MAAGLPSRSTFRDTEVDPLIRTRAIHLVPLLVRAALRPRLLVLMVRAGWRFRARGWYRRPPFLPLPPPDYLDWRLHTAYGDTGAQPTPQELERYLRWVVGMRQGPLAKG